MDHGSAGASGAGVSQTFAVVQQIAAGVFGVAESDISPESSPQTLERWDSVQQIYLVLALEERFGVQLALEDIEELKNLGDIAKAIDKKL
jgi:acyl carrier protein